MYDETLGKIAYEAYCKERGWKSFNGERLPHWDEQDESLKNALSIAGHAVSKHILNQTGRG